ncbi:MAG: succinate dehydrogenase assembly factor 2, partial [Gammaproteobacteria bacterium]|nr:succinate dehydrogenase assembly factor 2 [Gammaproteobacteria bacterium]
MTEISRLRWLCRRGMKELDLVMTGYLENYYNNAD